MWIRSNRVSGVESGGGVLLHLRSLTGRQHVHVLMSFIPGQTNRFAMSCCVTCTGCDEQFSIMNTIRWSGAGTNGRGNPVLMA